MIDELHDHIADPSTLVAYIMVGKLHEQLTMKGLTYYRVAVVLYRGGHLGNEIHSLYMTSETMRNFGAKSPEQMQEMLQNYLEEGLTE